MGIIINTAEVEIQLTDEQKAFLKPGLIYRHNIRAEIKRILASLGMEEKEMWDTVSRWLPDEDFDHTVGHISYTEENGVKLTRDHTKQEALDLFSKKV